MSAHHCYLLLDSFELSAKVFKFLDSCWNDRFSFALVNSHMSKIAFDTHTDLVYNMYDNSKKYSLVSFPSQTSTVIKTNESNALEDAFMSTLCEKYVHCTDSFYFMSHGLAAKARKSCFKQQPSNIYF